MLRSDCRHSKPPMQVIPAAQECQSLETTEAPLSLVPETDAVSAQRIYWVRLFWATLEWIPPPRRSRSKRKIAIVLNKT